MLNALRVEVTPRCFQRHRRADLRLLCPCFPQRNFSFSLLPAAPGVGGKVLAHSPPPAPEARGTVGVTVRAGPRGVRGPGRGCERPRGGRVRAPRRRRERRRAEGGGTAPGAGSRQRPTPSPRGSPVTSAVLAPQRGRPLAGSAAGAALVQRPGARGWPGPRPPRPGRTSVAPGPTEKMSANSILHFPATLAGIGGARRENRKGGASLGPAT